ncbi:hypothetical protein Nepgr_027806 [Nepenthes gracilis]|uniref:U6 snRNA-associated Sm-like protein LSm4 n=1 Tax=Nepenthes gracilis TaxID=150966 RepID=A0AAD3Y1R2_NEPGR|nr:hypothetical protein Nepgr_027806 [Nepenthes gracilis]
MMLIKLPFGREGRRDGGRLREVLVSPCNLLLLVLNQSSHWSAVNSWLRATCHRQMLPLSLLKTAQGHPMLVELKNGETYNGHLVNCDTWMNIHLREVICTSKDGDRFWRMPECYIRGNTIKYLRVPDEVIDKVQEETKSRSDRKPPGVGRGRGRGREDGPGRQPKGIGRGVDDGGKGTGRGRGGSIGKTSGKGGGRGRG